MFRRSVTLFVLLCVFAASLPGVASAHPPEAKTICPEGYTLSGDETECSKTDVTDHGEAECDSGYTLVSKTRGASVCEKEVGEPTCDEGTGDDCVITADLGPPTHCAAGSLKSGRCVTDHGKPTCATGNLKNGVCIGTADLGPPTHCAAGSLKSGRCVTDHGKPTHCAAGSLKSGRCVTDHGKPTCATGNLKNGVCIGTADFGPPKCAKGVRQGNSCVDTVGYPRCATGTNLLGSCVGSVGSPKCATGTRWGNSCVDTVVTTASYRCGSGSLTSGAYGIPVCRQTTSLRCPGGYSYYGGSCYHPTTFQLASPFCPSGYSKSGSQCVKYTSVSWYCTASQGSFRSPNKCVGTKVVGSPKCATGTRQGNDCVGKVGSPTCATGTRQGNECVGIVGTPTCAAGLSLQSGRCKGTSDLGPPKRCASGSLKSGRCVTDHGTPTCASGSLKSGRCVTDHGTPTCAAGLSLQSGRCKGTSDLGPPKRCASGSLKSGRCVTDHGTPTCATGNLKNGVCIGTTGSGTLKCATGQPQGSKCIDRKTPDCQKGSLEGTRCVSRTTDTTAPMNTLNHHVAHKCPTSHNYTPPLPDLLWIHITTEAVIDYSVYQNLDLVSRSYYEYPAWEQLDDTHDCHKPVLGTSTNLVKVIVDGVTYIIERGKAVIKKAANLAGKAKDAVEEASRIYAENLYRTARAAFDVLCSAPGQVISGAVAGYALAQTAIAASASASLAAASVTITTGGATAIVAISASAIAGTAIWLGCRYVIDNIFTEPKPNSAATGAPSISGTVRVGETLAAGTSGIADADGLGVFSYQWSGDGSAISGATSASYTLVAADEGKAISVAVSFTDGAGNAESVTSSPTAAVTAKPNSAATGVPSISGTVRVGETLTAGTSGIADADGLGVFAYQWSADSSAISGATSASYTLVAADEGKAISVAVSFTDGAGNAESVTSSPTRAVAAAEDSDDEDSDDEDSDDEAEPVSLSITSASCVKSGSKWVVSVSWETGEGLRTSVAVSENKAGGHYADKYSVGEFSETFDVPRWGTYSVRVFVRAEDQSLLWDRDSVECPY